MSELKVNTIQPATSSIVTITPSLEIVNSTQTTLFEVSNNTITITSPLKIGSSSTDVTAGIAYTIASSRTAVGVKTPQHLTSRGDGLSPVWTEGVPYGGIMMWWGLPTNVPTGWVLCDGRSYLISGLTWQTPDLRDRFIVGAGNLYSAASTGGYTDATLVSHTHTTQPHSHSYTYKDYNRAGGLGLDGEDDTDRANWTYTGTTSPATVVVNSTGESGVNKNLPPYHALCFIMKVPTS